jgi:hypothetical protein
MLATLTGGTAVSMMDVALGGHETEEAPAAQQAAEVETDEADIEPASETEATELEAVDAADDEDPEVTNN